MIKKKCEFCKKEIEAKRITHRFCSAVCQGKAYRKKPGILEKFRDWTRKYRETHPEWKERHRILASKHREKRAEYQKAYGKRADVRERIRKIEKLKRETDKEYVITDRLRRSLNHAMTKYSKEGKIMNSKKYGIDWGKIIEILKPFPKNLREFEIDHIVPLHTFNLNEIEQVKEAFHPSNLQWLTIKENRKKGGKIMEEKTLEVS